MRGGVKGYLRPILLISRISGVFPYDNEFNYHDIFCILPVVNVLLNIASLANFFAINHSRGGLLNTLLNGVVQLSANTVVLCGRSYFVRSKWANSMSIATSIERILQDKGYPVKHKRAPMFADICTRLTFTMIFCAYPFVLRLTPRENFTRLVSVCFPLWFMAIVQLQFVCCVQALRNVCKTLRTALKHTDDEVPLLEMGNLLITASKDVNGLYAIQAVLDLAYVFYDVCNNINVLIKSPARIESGLIVVEMLFYSYQLWRMTSVCSEFVNEVQKFDYTLFEIMMKTPSYVSSNESKKKCGAFMCGEYNTTFTACGLFKINYELMHSFVAGIGTYVALVQQINN
ncbi:hypothetical protein GE061_003540 [Apolygus lucorum]|uniref:Gustatory receptor n=1 Tax=Apolygus lucorum TaxID=248454 RepID=A0A8S9X6F1_APOLU|nr:hypothetical protein GE061_003540 [Apolygus lucorum]